MTVIFACSIIQKVAVMAIEKRDWKLLYECYRDFIDTAKQITPPKGI